MADGCPRSIHRLALAALAAAFLLVIAGGLVTSRDAGLAVPDWPLSYGTINPPHWWAIENVRTEHGHRLIALCVAFLTMGVTISALRQPCPKSVRSLATAAAVLVVLQAVLGGLRVLAMSLDLAMIHAVVAQVFFVVLALLAVASSPRTIANTTGQRHRSSDAAPLAVTTAALVGLQLVAGIIIRHQGPLARPLLGNSVFFLHGALALGILALTLRLRARVRRSRGADKPAPSYLSADLLPGLVGVQIGLGLATLMVTENMTGDLAASFWQAWLPTAHVAVGALVWAAAVILAVAMAGNPIAGRVNSATHVQGGVRG